MNYNFPRPNYQRPDTNIPGQTPPRDMYAKRNVRGAGALIMAKMTGRLLFALRASGKNKPQEWNLWGGKVTVDESPEQSVIGWTKKQTGYKGPNSVQIAYRKEHRVSLQTFKWSSLRVAKTNTGENW